METTLLWHQRPLFGIKVTLLLLVLLMAGKPLLAQESREYNLPTYDDRFLTYGFILGGHTSTLRPKFSKEFTDGAAFANVINILPSNAFGFSISFLANFRAAEYLSIRVMPGVAFYDYKLEFETTPGSDPIQDVFVDFTTANVPISLKFNSQRRGNHRMFLTGGVTPIIDITGKKKREENFESGLRLDGNNLTADVGFGADFYFPLFKFSPEIRYSYGLRDVLENKNSEVGRAFDRLGSHMIGLYLVFN